MVWVRARGGDYLSARRPAGFQRYIDEQGFHSLYLITTETGGPLKVGIASDPVVRFATLQHAHFEPLRLYRFWWLPGFPISSRIEHAFKKHFASHLIRGEWFDVPARSAVAFVEATIRSIGTWGIGQEDMIKLMQAWQLKCIPLLKSEKVLPRSAAMNRIQTAFGRKM